MPRQDSPESQSNKFIKAARAFGCDEDEEAFARTVRKVAKAKPGASANAKAALGTVDRKPSSE